MFESSFPREWAEEILKRIQRQYGSQFDKLYPMKPGQDEDQYENEMILMACEVLEGLTPENIKLGLNKMRSEQWCPTIPGFRGMCEPMSDWLTAEEAWAKVQAAGDDRNTVVWNEQEQAAWAACQPLIEIRDMFSAARCFKDAYKRELDSAMVHGKRPVYSVSLGYDQGQRVEVVRDAEKRGLLTNADATKAIGYIEEAKAPTPDFVRAKLADIWNQLESGNA